MARKSTGPWYREGRGQWCVTIRGKQYSLGADRETAYAEWHRLASQVAAAGSATRSADELTVAVLFETFLAWCDKNRPASYQWYSERLAQFAGFRDERTRGERRRIGELLVTDLKPFHATAWIDTKRSAGHKAGCLRAIGRAFNWAVKQGHIEKNPIRHVEKPQVVSVGRSLTDAEFKRLVAHAFDDQFRDVLMFSRETGSRPQETVRVAARHFDREHQCLILPTDEAKGKRMPRVIYLTPAALAIVERLAKLHPSGPLFRNADGNPWHRNNFACRFARLAKKLGLKYRLYHLRHTFITNGIKKGVDLVTMQHLAGHASLAMISRVYAHVEKDGDHMRNALAKANG
jgi:integrase